MSKAGSTSAARLFSPVKLGNATLKHRVVMPPLTRFRADAEHVPSVHAKTYYEQRASVPGTLIITEATFISLRAAGYNGAPGIWSEAQINAWREITDAVHAKGSYVYCQLWALGRLASARVLKEDGGFDVVGASPINANRETPNGPTSEPRALTEEEIKDYFKDYATAASNAMKAGFDGVEMHGANGYLIDQFWQEPSNQRTDQYGGSIENRSRFGLEATKAVIEAVGDSQKVAMRLSPWSRGSGKGMEDAKLQFVHVVEELRKLNMAYLHLVEWRTGGKSAVDAEYQELTRENDPLIKVWGSENPVILAGGYTPEKAQRMLDDVYPTGNILIGFGRYFISTPDLPYRLKNGIELNPYDRPTFYTPGPKGYIDYPFSESFRPGTYL